MRVCACHKNSQLILSSYTLVDHRKAILTWSDFKKSIKPNLTEWPAHRDVKEAFRVFDQEGINYIHANQLKRFMEAALGNTNLDDKSR